MSDEQFQIISSKLTLITALMLQSNSEGKSKSELIELLNKFNLSNSDIGSMLGMKPSAVAMAQSRLKKGTK